MVGLSVYPDRSIQVHYILLNTKALYRTTCDVKVLNGLNFIIWNVEYSIFLSSEAFKLNKSLCVVVFCIFLVTAGKVARHSLVW